ncbi:MAG: heme-copper oxidase subunit III [Flavobacteriales bacterium]|nr:heme-copper oxidase subunit III [Flavobacteriales bacterium]
MTTITAENISYKEELKQKTSKPLIWIGIVSIIMFFGGLTSAVIVSQGGGGFLAIEMPLAFTMSTIIIVMSSVTFYIGLLSAKKGNFSMTKLFVLLTLVLGLSFVVTQFMGWNVLHENGYYAAGSESTQESSFLYLLTGLHIAHLIGGLVSLIVVLVKTMKNKYSIDNLIGMQVSITYWHFLGALWVYLFLFLRFIIA